MPKCTKLGSGCNFVVGEGRKMPREKASKGLQAEQMTTVAFAPCVIIGGAAQHGNVTSVMSNNFCAVFQRWPKLHEENKELKMNDDMARIRVDGKYTTFTFRDQCIKFRTSTKLKKYLRVKEWDNGYLVVDVDYSTIGETEEYVDISSVLDDLYIDSESFLKPIKGVLIEHV